jgi:RNA polymerase sigma factor (TIGR02999 family)
MGTGRTPHDVTALLQAWRGGEEAALGELMPLVHGELQRLAHGYMRQEQVGHTLQTGALVNEVYLRLIHAQEVQWQDRAHFFALAANLMRRILVDYARTRSYQKRGGDLRKVSFDEALYIAQEPETDLVGLDNALKALEDFDPRKAKVVELRFFGGLSVDDTAEVLKVSPDTVKRDWRLAKVWLLAALTNGARDEA